MLRYILRRLAVAPLLLLGIPTLAFVVARIIPADPLASIVGRAADEQRASSSPRPRSAGGSTAASLEQYVKFLGNLVHGDLGTSFRTRQSVSSDLWERCPPRSSSALGALLFGGRRRHRARRRVGPLQEPARRPHRPRRRARRLVVAGVLARSHPALHVLRPARLVPRARPPPVAHRRARPVTGLYTVDALLHGNLGLAWQCAAPADAPGVRARLEPSIGHRLAARAGRDARRAARRLRAHRPGQGPRRGRGDAQPRAPQLAHAGRSRHGLSARRRCSPSAVLTETVFSWNGIGTYAVEATADSTTRRSTGCACSAA